MPATMPELDGLKAAQRAVWQEGDYRAIAQQLVFASERLCEALDLRAGDRVLDVAAGTGNAALAAARRHCDVVALDFAPKLLDRAGERAVAEGVAIRLVEGDAESLPFPDGAFDAVVSVFGCMFAPDQRQTAAELLRACRPGGQIGLACWTPDGFAGDLFGLLCRYAPPPPGLDPPSLWGTEDRLRELLGDGVSSLSPVRRTVDFRWRSAGEWVAFYRTRFGPVRATFEALDEEAQEALAADLETLVLRHDRLDGSPIAFGSPYLEVVAVRA